MPTGYTSDVASGKIVDFKEYAWRCARNFGALVTMRDEPVDAPIKRFEPTDWHVKRLVEARADLAEIEQATVAECKAMAKEDFNKECNVYDDLIGEKRTTKCRYENMLVKAKAFKPPTKDFTGFAAFLVSQLEESIRHDCDENYVRREHYARRSKMETANEWKDRRTKELKRDIEYNTERNNEEMERVRKRNEWVDQLRLALESC